MYLGDDVVMYVVLCSLATVLFMFASLANASKTWAYVMKILYGSQMQQTELEPRMFQRATGLIAIACTVLSILVTSIYYNGSSKNYKNQFMMSTVATFGGWVIVDLVLQTMLVKNMRDAFFSVYQEYTGDMTPRGEYGVPAWLAKKTVFYIAHFAIIGYLTMSVVCMWVDFASGDQPWSQMRYLLTFSIAGLLIIEILQIVLALAFKSTDSAMTMSGSVAYMMSLKVPEKFDHSTVAKLGSSLKPLQFGPTGDRLFDASVPEHRLLLEVERKVRSDGAKYGLSLKNYTVLQVGAENKYVVLTKEDASSILKLDPVAGIHRPKYGLLGKNSPVLDDDELKVDLRDKVPIASKIHTEAPCAVFYTHNVMGFGVGNGTWLALPYWFNWLIFMMDLASGCFIYRDAGVSAAIAFITTLPALIIGLLGPENGTFQLLAYNKVFGWGVIVLAYYVLPAGMKYVMGVAIMEDETATWLQYTGYANQAEDVATLIFTWVFFANVATYMMLSMIRICSVAGRMATMSATVLPEATST